MSNRRRLPQPAAQYGPLDEMPLPLAEQRVNAYRCNDCGGYTVTVDIHEGVTPMFLGCRAAGTETGCKGRAVSLGYPKGPRPSWATPAWEWYKPSAAELRRQSPEMRDHVQRGGLMLRRIPSSEAVSS